VGGRHENRRERQAGFIRDALPDPECEIAGEIDQIVREEDAAGRRDVETGLDMWV